MTNKITLALSVMLAIGSTSAFATNGDHMIGLSAESRALGGTGIANYTGSGGAGNGLTNPALLAKSKSKTEFDFAGTFFKPTVKVSSQYGASGSGGATGVDKTSAQDFSVIPAIALSHRINEKIVVGLGMYGTAGMGTDWRGSAINFGSNEVELYNMRSSLMLMQFTPSIAYGTDRFGIGLTAIMQYGSLSVDFDGNDGANNIAHVGTGVSDDFGYGFQIGGYYNPSKELTIGAVYKSAIDMEYRDQISNAARAFGYGAHAGALAAKTDHLEQPSELGLGVSYDTNTFMVTAEIKEIKWGESKGYKDFGWENQTVYALGAKYKGDGYWVGAGFNYGKNPIKNNTDSTSVAGGPNTNGNTMNMFNYVMFPGTVESTYTVGTGFSLSDGIGISLAYTYAPEVSDTVSALTVGAGNITTKHTQQALTIGVKFLF